jgi:uncharacterized protein YndB with AHSA1/START domain
MPNAVSLHRVFTAPPERVFRAFTDAGALCKWLPPYGFTGHIDRIDAREGGSYHMTFTNFAAQDGHSFTTTFVEMKVGERLRYTSKFDDASLPGVMTVTVTFVAVSCGTDVKITQEGIPDVIPAEMCMLGWQQSLQQLAKVVEGPAT